MLTQKGSEMKISKILQPGFLEKALEKARKEYAMYLTFLRNSIFFALFVRLA